MSEPTAYDEIQDGRLEELEGVVTVSANPIEGPEYSFPIPDYPVNQEQFQLLGISGGNGVIDRGEASYWLKGWGSSAETNQRNSMRLTVGRNTGKAEAVVAGFYHVLEEDLTVELPGVTSTTTYYVCLTYDPRDQEEGRGPISIQVYDSEPPTSFGRVSVVLWTVTRKPNQLLTDADIQRHRQRVSPPIYVHSEDQLPDVRTVLWGSIAFVAKTSDIMRALPRDENDPSPNAGDGKWESLLAPPFSNPGDTGAYEWVGHGYRRGYRRVGDVLEFRGRIKRTSTSNPKFAPGGGDHLLGYQLYNMANEDDWPEQEQRFVTASSSLIGQKLCIITAATNGVIYGMPVLGEVDWMGLDGVRVVVKE